MMLWQLQLVREMDQPPDEVLLTCLDGAQTILVSIPRLVLDDFARQRGWGPLAPSDQNFLVDINRGALLALIQRKYEDGQATQRNDRKTGRSIPLITLSRSDIDRGVSHVLHSTAPFAASLGDTSEEPDLTPLISLRSHRHLPGILREPAGTRDIGRPDHGKAPQRRR
jgi:hypothetical protein